MDDLNKGVNLPAEGTMAAPPADAPMLPSQPLQPDAGSILVARDIHDRETGELLFRAGEMITPAQRAAQNERELKPLTFQGPNDVGPGKTVAAPAPVAPVIESPVAGKQIHGLDPFYQRLEDAKAAKAAAPVSLMPAPPNVPVARSEFPAASDTDTPSRGIPKLIRDPGKQITGGFGMAPNEYFALNGVEVQELVRQLLGEVDHQITNDLRFSLSTCYPRIKVTLTLRVECAVQEAPVEITKYREDNRTPIDLAMQYADQVCFVVVRGRSETTPEGDVETPADAIRDELQLPKPGKRMLPGGQIADVLF